MTGARSSGYAGFKLQDPVSPEVRIDTRNRPAIGPVGIAICVSVTGIIIPGMQFPAVIGTVARIICGPYSSTVVVQHGLISSWEIHRIVQRWISTNHTGAVVFIRYRGWIASNGRFFHTHHASFIGHQRRITHQQVIGTRVCARTAAPGKGKHH